MTDIASAVAEVCRRRIAAVAPIAGGDICAAWRVRFADGSVAFAKSFQGDAAMFDAEARSLRWLAQVAAPVPSVLGAGDDVLVLSWLAAAQPSRSAAERLGRALAAMHSAGPDTFGADWPGYAGRLRLANTPAPSWAEFFAATRLLPLIGQAVGTGAVRNPAGLERVAHRLGPLAGPAEPPARLHGDLWSGNLLWGTDHAWLIDPAAYGGHRETDLAMLDLFGTPYLDTIVGAYKEVSPLADGWRERIGLHQLHPVLAHAVMFGGSYGARAEAIARRYA